MKVADVMTPCPYSIASGMTLTEALEVMGLRNIRHLPVVDAGQLIGVLTERDAKLAQLLGEGSEVPQTAGGVCSKDPYVAQSDEEVGPICYEMAERKIDCALIADPDGAFVGIFTSTDAFRLTYMLLGQR